MTKKLLSVEQACIRKGALEGIAERKKPKRAVAHTYVTSLRRGQTAVRRIWYVAANVRDGVVLRPILFDPTLYFYDKPMADKHAKDLNKHIRADAAKIGIKFHVVPLTMSLTLAT